MGSTQSTWATQRTLQPPTDTLDASAAHVTYERLTDSYKMCVLSLALFGSDAPHFSVIAHALSLQIHLFGSAQRRAHSAELFDVNAAHHNGIARVVGLHDVPRNANGRHQNHLTRKAAAHNEFARVIRI